MSPTPSPPQPLPGGTECCEVLSSLTLTDEDLDKLGFEKVTEAFIGECKSEALLLRHKRTGVQVASMSNDDENKVFGIVFRTPLKDSTGISYILQKAVRCGSRKYPLKKPFDELLKGSLGACVDHFKYSDRSCYPVMSPNTKDFYNLVDMTLDAVFFAKCMEDLQIFPQEGRHYELNHPCEDITYKGAAFNERKDFYSQPSPKAMLKQTVEQAVFPDNSYGFDVLGDPKVIPKLTFEEFKEFHRKHYHPSNARIWFYGDDDPTEHLRILSEYLEMFDASSAAIEKVKPPKLFSKPVKILKKYPSGQSGDLKKDHMSLSWCLCEMPLDMETERTIELLINIMSATMFSPLNRILLSNGFRACFAGVHFHLLQPLFSIGLKSLS